MKATRRAIGNIASYSRTELRKRLSSNVTAPVFITGRLRSLHSRHRRNRPVATPDRRQPLRTAKILFGRPDHEETRINTNGPPVSQTRETQNSCRLVVKSRSRGGRDFLWGVSVKRRDKLRLASDTDALQYPC